MRRVSLVLLRLTGPTQDTQGAFHAIETILTRHWRLRRRQTAILGIG
jgi:hypothetical protein